MQVGVGRGMGRPGRAGRTVSRAPFAFTPRPLPLPPVPFPRASALDSAPEPVAVSAVAGGAVIVDVAGCELVELSTAVPASAALVAALEAAPAVAAPAVAAPAVAAPAVAAPAMALLRGPETAAAASGATACPRAACCASDGGDTARWRAMSRFARKAA